MLIILLLYNILYLYTCKVIYYEIVINIDFKHKSKYKFPISVNHTYIFIYNIRILI